MLKIQEGGALKSEASLNTCFLVLYGCTITHWIDASKSLPLFCLCRRESLSSCLSSLRSLHRLSPCLGLLRAHLCPESLLLLLNGSRLHRAPPRLPLLCTLSGVIPKSVRPSRPDCSPELRTSYLSPTGQLSWTSHTPSNVSPMEQLCPQAVPFLCHPGAQPSAVGAH